MTFNSPRAHVDHVSRVLRTAEVAPTLPVPSAILDSWRRSIRNHQLDPGSLQGPRILEARQIHEHRERVEDFLRLAGDEMSRLHGHVRDADYCVMLTDTSGCTIDYRIDSSIRGEYRRAGMDLGTCWSESEEGTTGVCAVLINRQPITVHKQDHFRAAFIGITCSAAPVFSPTGDILAVLDVSAVRSPDDRRSQHLIRHMVMQSAAEIENAYFMYSTQDLWVLRAHGMPGFVDSQPEYLFAWDADGVIRALNPAARRLLIQRHGRLPEHIQQAFAPARLPGASDEGVHYLSALGLHVRLKAPRRAISVGARQSAAPESPAVQALRMAVRVKDRGLPVLIHGETGAGKEHFARQLHGASKRQDKPFVAVNCAAIPESLIESELFGYSAGAFTGASSKGMRGLLQQANGGTLFLDEIGDMPLSLQTRLLRALSEGEVAPLGASRPEAIDIQVICATHRDLSTLVENGSFREDLYFRLSGARFDVPPLRERADKLALINKLLDDEGQRSGVRLGLSEAALEVLLTYNWPGNMRQLQHVLRYACAVCDGPAIAVEDLPAPLGGIAPTRGQEVVSGSPERQALIDALVRNRWKPVLAARDLGISRATLYRKVNHHGINMPGKGSYS
ncbi:sigma-54-dependent Fis family transcriptional regulator [Pseudomonas aeruginosa]|nr:sigma-54-dependent Fis family transcriptional regulator [Pseudomonas aeruginosa]MDI3676705.1 sigma-54-dependent Fis family transcriptional regulator [Pseudomonas aeruginosa]MDI3706961.1 sigma-54-dependent Fis family transcriptional regulator [Pseudomonas aeruginosa]MDI3761150.1 sigma-54-dependent Fis family transcriptional regulator [Pseudomonas aeruginosa]MDI3779844.1 sigma-54-dependent Fis family transcriptional regulator [Pseudomonas aeruginosa]